MMLIRCPGTQNRDLSEFRPLPPKPETAEIMVCANWSRRAVGATLCNVDETDVRVVPDRELRRRLRGRGRRRRDHLCDAPEKIGDAFGMGCTTGLRCCFRPGLLLRTGGHRRPERKVAAAGPTMRQSELPVAKDRIASSARPAHKSPPRPNCGTPAGCAGGAAEGAPASALAVALLEAVGLGATACLNAGRSDRRDGRGPASCRAPGAEPAPRTLPPCSTSGRWSG